VVRVHSLALSAAGAFRQRLVALPLATLQTLSDAEDDLLLGFHVSNVSECREPAFVVGGGQHPAPMKSSTKTARLTAMYGSLFGTFETCQRAP
jgi:hypothetical protein